MLIIASTTPTNALGKSFGPLHDLPDQAALVRSICAFSETVADAQELPQLIERAWNVFTSQRPRPVHLAIPMDVLEQMCTRFEKVDTAARRPVSAASEIKSAAELINAATSPIVIAGGGCVDAGAQLAKFAEAIDAPVVLSGNAKGVLSSSHPLCAGNCLVFGRVQRDIEAAELVIVVGTELSDADLYNGGQALQFGGNVIRIDIDDEQLARRTTPTVGLVGDAGETLSALMAAIHAKTSTDGQEQAITWR